MVTKLNRWDIYAIAALAILGITLIWGLVAWLLPQIQPFTSWLYTTPSQISGQMKVVWAGITYEYPYTYTPLTIVTLLLIGLVEYVKADKWRYADSWSRNPCGSRLEKAREFVWLTIGSSIIVSYGILFGFYSFLGSGYTSVGMVWIAMCMLSIPLLVGGAIGMDIRSYS